MGVRCSTTHTSRKDPRAHTYTHVQTCTHTRIPGRRGLDAVDGDHAVAALVLHPVHRYDVQPHLPVPVEQLCLVGLLWVGVGK